MPQTEGPDAPRGYNSIVINEVHGMVFSEDADPTRAFLRDVLGFESVDPGAGTIGLYQPTHPSPLGE